MNRNFSKIHIEITNQCNLKCSFCPAVERPSGWMSLALFEQVLQQVAPLTPMVCLHLMGEPLGHPDLPAMVELCHQYGLKIFLVSNGVRLRGSLKTLLLHPAFFQVNFSLHSFPDNFRNRDPHSYLEHILAYSELALAQRPDLYINFRLWNLHEARGNSPANQMMLEAIAARFDSELATKLSALKTDGFNRGLRHGVKLRGRLSLHFDGQFVWPSLDLPQLGTHGTCHALKTHIGILTDGTVVPCCLDKEGVIALGRIQEMPLIEILASTRARALRQGFAKGQLLESLCQRCNYIERFATKKVVQSHDLAQ